MNPRDLPPQPAVVDEEPDELAEFLYRPDEPAGDLPDLAESQTEAIAVEEPLREYLAFDLVPEAYAVPIGEVREIVRDPLITDVPRSAPHVLGVMMIRGQVVPVFDLRKLLNLPAPSAGGATPVRAVIVDVGRGPCAMKVDSVRQVLRLRDSAIESTPPGVGAGDPEAFRGIARVQGRIVVLLDLAHVLGVGDS